MVTVEKLIDGLYREAARRDKLGHHVVAHELRREAQKVSSAQAYLAGSLRVKS